MGRGSSKAAGGTKTVPLSRWGRHIPSGDPENVYGEVDGYRTLISSTWDEWQYNQEPDVRPITKKAILEDIRAWENDDGTYGAGDGDVAIGIAYDDGSYVRLTDLEEGERWKKRGIIGAHISTPDYESVWGGERNSRTGEIVPYRTSEFDDFGNSIEGFTNSYSGYRSTQRRLVRRRTTNYRDDRGRWRHRHETLRQSPWQNM